MSARLRNFDQRIIRLKTEVEEKEQKPIETPAIIVPTDYGEFCSSITMRSGGKIRRFDPYRYQVLLAGLIRRFKNTTVVKTRQLGTTQSLIAYFLHEAAQNPAYAASCFMRNDDDAKAINSRIRWLAEQAKLDLAVDQDKLIRLLNGAEIRTHNQSKEGNRSADSLCALLFDEAAFQTNIATIYAASVASTILSGDAAKVIVVSTPSAKSGWFWDRLSSHNGDRDVETICRLVASGELYSDGLPGFYWFVDELGGCKVFIHWLCHPVYSLRENFVEDMAQELELEWADAQREFNLIFEDKAVEVFSAESVSDAENDDREPRLGRNACCIGLYISRTHTSAVALIDNVVVNAVSIKDPSANTAINAVLEVSRGYNISTIALKGSDGGEEIAKRLRVQHRSTKVIEVAKADYPNTVTSLSLLMEDRLIRIPKYKNSLRDIPIAKHLRDFRRQNDKLGAIDPSRRDDCAWALAFSVKASENISKHLPIGSR